MNFMRQSVIGPSAPRRHFLSFVGALATTATFTDRAAWAAGSVRSRPLGEFLEVQGTFCVADGSGGCYLFVPPAPNFIGWSELVAGQSHTLFAGVDYAGLANDFLGNPFGTTVTGSVTERPLADGRAQVQVKLFTQRANTWVIDLDLEGDVLGQIAAKPTVFGRRPQDPGEKALSQSTFAIHFTIEAPGAPLPDLIPLFNAPDTTTAKLEFVGFGSQGSGPLRAEWGVADGTPGRCHIRQTGLVTTAGRASPRSRVALDAFPAENIELRATGR